MFESNADRGREIPIRVVVVDDHAILRSGVVRLLADAGSIAVVGEAEGVEQALGEIERGEPDVVLLDLDMPGVGGIDGCREICSGGRRWGSSSCRCMTIRSWRDGRSRQAPAGMS